MSNFKTKINGVYVDINDIFEGTTKRNNVLNFVSNTSAQLQGNNPYTTYVNGPGKDQYDKYLIDVQRYTNFIPSGVTDLANMFAAVYQNFSTSWINQSSYKIKNC